MAFWSRSWAIVFSLCWTLRLIHADDHAISPYHHPRISNLTPQTSQEILSFPHSTPTNWHTTRVQVCFHLLLLLVCLPDWPHFTESLTNSSSSPPATSRQPLVTGFTMPTDGDDDPVDRAELADLFKTLSNEMKDIAKKSLPAQEPRRRRRDDDDDDDDDDLDDDDDTDGDDAPRPREITPDTLTDLDPIKWVTFRRSFLHTTTLNKWGPNRAILMLQNSMKGAAARATSHVDLYEAANLQEALDKYAIIFVNPAARTLYKSQFKSAHRDQGEEIILWHTRLRELFLRAYPDAADIETNEDLKEIFTIRLRNNPMSHSLYSAENYGSLTYTELLTRAQTLQGSIMLCSKPSIQELRPGVSFLDSGPASSEVQAMTKKNPRPKSKTVRCFFCDNLGHVISECRKYKSSQKTGGSPAGAAAPRFTRGRGRGRSRGFRGRGRGSSSGRGRSAPPSYQLNALQDPALEEDHSFFPLDDSDQGPDDAALPPEN